MGAGDVKVFGDTVVGSGDNSSGSRAKQWLVHEFKHGEYKEVGR